MIVPFIKTLMKVLTFLIAFAAFGCAAPSSEAGVESGGGGSLAPLDLQTLRVSVDVGPVPLANQLAELEAMRDRGTLTGPAFASAVHHSSVVLPAVGALALLGALRDQGHLAAAEFAALKAAALAHVPATATAGDEGGVETEEPTTGGAPTPPPVEDVVVREVLAEHPPEAQGLRDEWALQTGWHRREAVDGKATDLEDAVEAEKVLAEAAAVAAKEAAEKAAAEEAAAKEAAEKAEAEEATAKEAAEKAAAGEAAEKEAAEKAAAEETAAKEAAEKAATEEAAEKEAAEKAEAEEAAAKKKAAAVALSAKAISYKEAEEKAAAEVSEAVKAEAAPAADENATAEAVASEEAEGRLVLDGATSAAKVHETKGAIGAVEAIVLSSVTEAEGNLAGPEEAGVKAIETTVSEATGSKADSAEAAGAEILAESSGPETDTGAPEAGSTEGPRAEVAAEDAAAAMDALGVPAEEPAEVTDASSVEAAAAAEPQALSVEGCIGWRQTGGCTPDGPREVDSDLTCDAEVPAGASGYCECDGDGLKAAESDCDHGPFVCAARCAAVRQCAGWRQTGGCTPDGPRESASDLGCEEEVPAGASGYCECTGGLKAAESDCNHGPFTCAEKCAGGY